MLSILKHRLYDPIDHVHAMKQRPDLRLFVVSDRNDKLVSYRSQLEFVERVKAHNLPITHVTATATDKYSHGLFAHGHRLAVDCANGPRPQPAVSSRPGPVLSPQPRAPFEALPPLFPPQPPAAAPPALSVAPVPRGVTQCIDGRCGPIIQPSTVGQRVTLYEEDPSDQHGKRFVGSVIWRTEMLSDGLPRVRADIEIAERRITVILFIQRDLNQATSHTVEILFYLPADFPFGGIQNVSGVLMKQGEQTRGSPLGGAASKFTSDYFQIGLSAVTTDMQRNMQLLKEGSWFDIPIVYNDGRRAILSIEKGTPGERALEEAFKAWGQTSANSFCSDFATLFGFCTAQTNKTAVSAEHPTVGSKPVQDRLPQQSGGVDPKPVQDRQPQDPPRRNKPESAYALASTISTPVDFAPIKVRTIPIMLYGEKPPGPSEPPADAVRPKPERADTIKPLSAFSRAMPGMHDRLTTGPKPVQDPLKPQFGGPTPNRVKTQTIKLPSDWPADPKPPAHRQCQRSAVSA